MAAEKVGEFLVFLPDDINDFIRDLLQDLLFVKMWRGLHIRFAVMDLKANSVDDNAMLNKFVYLSKREHFWSGLSYSKF